MTSKTGTLVVLKPEKRIIVINKNNRGMKNPLKGKPQCTELKPELAEKVNKAIADLVTYDAEEADSLKDFNVVKANTECIFAKRSKIWGTPSWENDLSIEENIFKILPTFLKFTMCCEALGLDGFLIQMPHKYAANIKVSAYALQFSKNCEFRTNIVKHSIMKSKKRNNISIVTINILIICHIKIII